MVALVVVGAIAILVLLLLAAGVNPLKVGDTLGTMNLSIGPDA